MGVGASSSPHADEQTHECLDVVVGGHYGRQIAHGQPTAGPTRRARGRVVLCPIRSTAERVIQFEGLYCLRPEVAARDEGGVREDNQTSQSRSLAEREGADEVEGSCSSLSLVARHLRFASFTRNIAGATGDAIEKALFCCNSTSSSSSSHIRSMV